MAQIRSILLGSMLIGDADPKYEEEVSGCTASVGLISKTKIYVVGVGNVLHKGTIGLIDFRQMPVIRGLYSVSKDEQNLYHMTISLKTRVSQAGHYSDFHLDLHFG